MDNTNYTDQRAKLVRLIKNIEKQGVLTNLDQLEKELQAKLNKLRTGEHIGLYDQNGQPVDSLRALAKVIGNEGVYSHLSSFAQGEITPCFRTLQKIADVMKIDYIITSVTSSS